MQLYRLLPGGGAGETTCGAVTPAPCLLPTGGISTFPRVLSVTVDRARESFFFFFFFLGPHLQHMDVPRLGVESELHL